MSKIRATRESFKDAVGKARYELIKNAIGRVLQSQKEGYYLEAIAILESLIADRLESALSDSENKSIGFKNLGTLIDFAKKSSQLDSEIKQVTVNDLDTWRVTRNVALHQMVKLETGNLHDWDGRYNELEEQVQNGIEIFKKISNRIRKIRREE